MEVGFYGKLPSHGDFLRRRVSDSFVGVWDGWLQECVAASKSILGDRWLDVYLTSPSWRFACAAGLFGPAPMIGLMVPSVDRVGRYFHLTLVAELPQDTGILSAVTALGPVFDRAQQLVIDTLAAERVDLERFDEEVTRLGAELEALCGRPTVLLDASAHDIVNGAGQGAWQIPIGSPDQMGPVLEQILSQHLSRLYRPLVVWWTDGTAAIEPTCLIAKGLPPPEAFTALLDGSWTTDQYWQSVPARVEAERCPPEPELLVEDPTPPRYRSAGATDVGRVRTINQDSLLERTEVGLWAVADGLGGHANGEIASRMVCDALADFVPDASFEQMVEAAGERLHEVNDHLVRIASRNSNGGLSGSTVVALMARGTRCAVLWVGDSRVYRMRSGELQQLTRDHSLAESDGLTAPANVITRAVGGEAALDVDLYRDRVQPGDRFLLCSDGLTKIVPEAEIQHWVEQPDIRVGVEGLISTTLSAGAPDNVTVLIVEAYS